MAARIYPRDRHAVGNADACLKKRTGSCENRHSIGALNLSTFLIGVQTLRTSATSHRCVDAPSCALSMFVRPSRSNQQVHLHTIGASLIGMTDCWDGQLSGWPVVMVCPVFLEMTDGWDGLFLGLPVLGMAHSFGMGHCWDGLMLEQPSSSSPHPPSPVLVGKCM